MLELTRAKATLTVPYAPQEVCARLEAEKAFFEKHHLTCTATEDGVRLEPKWHVSAATDSYTPSGWGTLNAVEEGTCIDMEFAPGSSGVLLLAAVLLFGIGSLAVLLIQMGRGESLPWWRYVVPPGILVVGILSLMETLHTHKKGMMYLLQTALDLET